MSSSIDGASLGVSSELADAGTHINSVAAAIADKLVQLRSTLQPIAETWIGPSASYYEPLQEEWNYAAIGLFGDQSQEGILGEIAAAMHVTWGNYSDAEWANVQTWKPKG